ncbi:MAG: hypothetical protein K2W96_19840 [Gemmataceae bacterium]|nr:hypothetical protein [Gemmataceae bacterium]
MILKFPSMNSLRLALITGAVPAAMAQAGAVVGTDDQGHVWVETSGTLSRGNNAELKKLGVMGAKALPAIDKAEVSCWAEALPLDREPWNAEGLATLPVLFDLPDAAELSRLVIETLRLGNDRQGYRWLDSTGDEEPRALLRVVGPPYYTLLRAIDRIGGDKAPVAYVEKQPRVWVELGWSHPLVAQVKPPAEKILLLQSPGTWTLIDDGSFKDVYEVTEFPLPDTPAKFKDSKTELPKIKVVPSLRSGGSTDGAEMWVLRDDPVAELNRFVQNNNDQDLQRLAFAVGEKGGKKVIVVRVRSSKSAPPEVILHGAIAYKHYLKLPNLFLPVGTRLHPPLRRDQVRKLLADDTNSVTWLHPDAKGNGFSPQSLPEDAFRPLWDWVDYVLDHDKEALAGWMQAAQFDFEPFVCDEEDKAKPKKPPGEGAKPRATRERGQRGQGDDAAFAVQEQEAEVEVRKGAVEDLPEVKKAEPTQLQKQLKEMEESFLALEGGLDTPERQEMWPRMAQVNTQLANTDDAGICWMNSLWERDEAVARKWAWAWFLAEAQGVPAGDDRRSPRSWATKATLAGAKTCEVPGDDLDKLLAKEEPATADLRALSAYIVHACLQSPPSPALMERLGKVSRYLEQHEKLLPVRSMWLAWSHLSLLSRGDVLALARARDRLLERLFHSGLRPEQDLPSFLRFAGQPTSQRFRAVRQWMVKLADECQEWITATTTSGLTPAYVDLAFAYGLARLGESDVARELMARAKDVLAGKDDAHTSLFAAYEWRIKQALDGKPHTGPLPNEQMEYLEVMPRLERYVVDRLRKHSRILEPDTETNPYRHWGARINEFEKALAELADLTDRNEIANRVEKMLREVPRGPKGAEQRSRVLKAGLEAAPRVGEEFARKLLELAVPTYDELPEAKEVAAIIDHAALLEKALFVAGHFNRQDALHPLVTRFQRMLQTQKGAQALAALEKLAASCLRGLRKLGMRDEIDQILKQMAELVLEGHDVKSAEFKKRDQYPAAMRALLQVAGNYYYFGRDTQADAIMGVARGVLLGGDLPPREQTQLASSYARAVGQAPVEMAQKRLEEVFKQLKGIRDTYTTSTHFSVSQLDVVESVVQAVVSDDFTMGTQARRWLDDDEFLVRRRIHRDMRQAQASEGR